MKPMNILELFIKELQLTILKIILKNIKKVKKKKWI